MRDKAEKVTPTELGSAQHNPLVSHMMQHDENVTEACYEEKVKKKPVMK